MDFQFPSDVLVDANVTSGNSVTIASSGLMTSAGLYFRHPWSTIPYLVVIATASVVGTLGNLLIIGTLCRSAVRFRSRGTVGNIFIVNLACSDLIVTAVINPMAVTGAIVGPRLFEDDGRQWLCSAMASLCVTSCVVSLLSIGSIGVNRYVYICHHGAYRSVFAHRNCLLVVLLTWVAGVAIDAPSHSGTLSAHAFDRKTQKCLWDRTTSHHYTIFFVTVGMLLPLGVIVACYWRIFMHIRLAKQRVLAMQDRSMSSKAKSLSQQAIVKTVRQVKMIFVIFVAFTVCWAPYIVVLLSDAWDVFPLNVHLYASMVAHLHASLNFAIYGLANRALRAGYKDFIVRRLCGCVVGQGGCAGSSGGGAAYSSDDDQLSGVNQGGVVHSQTNGSFGGRFISTGSSYSRRCRRAKRLANKAASRDRADAAAAVRGSGGGTSGPTCTDRKPPESPAAEEAGLANVVAIPRDSNMDSYGSDFNDDDDVPTAAAAVVAAAASLEDVEMHETSGGYGSVERILDADVVINHNV